jgi:hypothetical protein
VASSAAFLFLIFEPKQKDRLAAVSSKSDRRVPPRSQPFKRFLAIGQTQVQRKWRQEQESQVQVI